MTLGVFYLIAGKTRFVEVISFIRPTSIARKGRRAFGHTCLSSSCLFLQIYLIKYTIYLSTNTVWAMFVHYNSYNHNKLHLI